MACTFSVGGGAKDSFRPAEQPSHSRTEASATRYMGCEMCTRLPWVNVGRPPHVGALAPETHARGSALPASGRRTVPRGTERLPSKAVSMHLILPTFRQTRGGPHRIARGGGV